MAIGVQRQTDLNPITIVFAGINDHLHSRGFLSRLRDPTTAENDVWPAIKDILESMGEVMDATKEGSFNKITPRIVFALSPGYACLPDGLKFVYAIVTLLSERKYDVIISAPNRMIEMENLRSLRAELPAVWSDISNAMRGFKDHALHMLVLDEVLGLELSNFSRQLKLKPGIDDDHRVIVAMSNDLWFRAMEKTGESTRRKKFTRDEISIESDGSENQAGSQPVATPKSSSSGIGWRCFWARPCDDHEDPCLLVKGGELGGKCRRKRH